MIKSENVLERNVARRDFLKTTSGLAAAAAFGGFTLPALAYVPPTRSRGSTVISVKDTGAVGNGVHDDTSAIQAAVNKLPSTGGTVYIPDGTYLIDTIRKINLRSLMMLKLSAGAVLKAKTSSVSRAYVVYARNVSDVEIAGGQVVGERDTHRFVSGTTDEWNHGIQILGCKRVTVRDIRVSKCTGDGICVGGAAYDVVVDNVVCTANRRQGLSLTHCSNIKVYDSEFSYTQGTSPECGIDIEPDPGYTCSNIRVQNCRLYKNAKYGINIWKNASSIVLTGNTFEYNGSLGLSTYYCSGVTVTSNTFRYNSATGVVYNAGTRNLSHGSNMSYGNYTRLGIKTRTPFTQTGWSSKIERDVLIRSSTGTVSIRTNNYK
ncbi:MAG: twin-arginine translocation signal domain-containing protein [Lysobacter sp.]|nr:twin-arginine translocation signal domain-containing protein [Lysobacter sp.]